MHRFLSYWWKTVAEYYSVSSKLQIATSWYKYVHTSSIWLERGKIQLSRTGWIMPIEQVVASKMCFLSYAVPERKVCYPKWQCPGSALVTDFYMAQGLPHTQNRKYIRKSQIFRAFQCIFWNVFSHFCSWVIQHALQKNIQISTDLQLTQHHVAEKIIWACYSTQHV